MKKVELAMYSLTIKSNFRSGEKNDSLKRKRY